MSWLMSARGRAWIYGVALAAISVLGIYGIVSQDQAAGWMVLAAAIAAPGPVTALRHITPDAEEGDGDGSAN